MFREVPKFTLPGQRGNPLPAGPLICLTFRDPQPVGEQTREAIQADLR